ncbi:apolipoprotein D [Aplysia californica]|uniref:Apolipoprotein D n=1 Tax=Aplysia californica TaxID=6500 RepID=A0ABM0JPI2_APLCA|nr:apolipoprotein D [Aplysia californica]
MASRQGLLSVVTLLCVGATTLDAASLALKPGQCPSVTTQATLDVSKYLGLWYEIQRFPIVFERGTCITAEYSLKPNGRVKVDNRFLEKGVVNQAIGEAYQQDPVNKPAVLSVSFRVGSRPALYNIIETDYSTHTLIYSCENFGSTLHVEFAWILSRTRSLNATTVQRLETKLGSFGIDTKQFLVTDQTGCSNVTAPITDSPLVG